MSQLVEDADVVIHNMRGLSALALGIAYEQLRLFKPDLVYCWSPGFASHGPDANSPAYDDIIQARSGMAALNADADGAPQFVRSVLCDKVVGLHLAMSVSAALVPRERTGEGQSIEVPMLETMAGFILAEHLAGRTMTPSQGDIGYQRLMSNHRRPFETADGYMAIMPYSTNQWIRFLELVGETSLAGEAWVSNGAERSNRIDELYELIALVAVRHYPRSGLKSSAVSMCLARWSTNFPRSLRIRSFQRQGHCSAHLTITMSVICTTSSLLSFRMKG